MRHCQALHRISSQHLNAQNFEQAAIYEGDIFFLDVVLLAACNSYQSVPSLPDPRKLLYLRQVSPGRLPKRRRHDGCVELHLPEL